MKFYETNQMNQIRLFIVDYINETYTYSSINDFCEKSGNFDQSTLNKFLNGERDISLPKFLQLLTDLSINMKLQGVSSPHINTYIDRVEVGGKRPTVKKKKSFY